MEQPDDTVELDLPATPEHVRTARLVSVAVARRLGLDDPLVEEVRLAVGEACARHLLRSPEVARLRLVLRDGRPGGGPGLHVVVLAPGAASTAPDVDDLSLAVLRGLVPDLVVEGDRVELHWPAPPR